MRGGRRVRHLSAGPGRTEEPGQRRRQGTIQGFAFLFLLWLASCAQQPFVTVRELPAYNSLFAREAGWTGGDGAYSTVLSGDRILWLFGDTLIGRIENGRHVDTRLINNSVALQRGRDPITATVEFYYREGAAGRPEPFVRPPAPERWFWAYDGIMGPDGLHFFLMELERAEPSGFRLVGTWLAQVAEPGASPLAWQIRMKRIPWARFSDSGNLFFGSAILAEKDFYYIYGIDEDIGEGWPRKYMILARAPRDHLGDFDQWRFYAGGAWRPDTESITRLCGEMANEYSVSFMAGLGRYVAIYTDMGVSDRIVARTGPTPQGPWSSPLRLYTCPEASESRSIVCYAGKGHPALSPAPDTVIVTYVANAVDFDAMLADARLYRPRFLEVRFSRR